MNENLYSRGRGWKDVSFYFSMSQRWCPTSDITIIKDRDRVIAVIGEDWTFYPAKHGRVYFFSEEVEIV